MNDDAVLRRSALLASGLAEHELRAALRSGALVPLARGRYARRVEVDDPRVRHLLRARARLDLMAPDAVLSHVTAALLHGLPVWGLPLDRVCVTRPTTGGGRRGGPTRVRTAVLPPDDVVLVAGLPVTSPARTVVDVLRSVGFEAGVALADAALHARLASRTELLGALESAAHRPGIVRARRVVRFADGRSESVGESRSRVAIARAGLPAPWPQPTLLDLDRRHVARVDFLWQAVRTVGEFDGMVKYRADERGRPAQAVVEAEKLREDRVRDLGLEVVRWVWADLRDFRQVRARLERAFARGRRR